MLPNKNGLSMAASTNQLCAMGNCLLVFSKMDFRRNNRNSASAIAKSIAKKEW